MGLTRRPDVTDFTRDATATQEDVRSGKIFYSAEGKQTGILSPLEEKSFAITIGTASTLTDTNYAQVIHYSKYKLYGISQGAKKKYTPAEVFEFLSLEHEIKAFTGITVDGVFYPIALPLPQATDPGIYVQFNNSSGKTSGIFTLVINSENIGAFRGGVTDSGGSSTSASSSSAWEGKTITIHYI